MHKRFLPYSRFRSRVVQDLTGAWWQEQEVDLDHHIVHSHLPSAKARSNKAELERMVGVLSATPLDRGKPLWQMHVIDNCVARMAKSGKRSLSVFIIASRMHCPGRRTAFDVRFR